MVAADQLVVAAGDVDGMSGYGDAQRAVLAERTGVVLQPDQEHGLQLFKTPFPKIARAEFPPGRALHVTRGVVTRVQLASAD
jgi:S-DNA-T family DNA segregation ATPase FtsK/SpoIIIE